MAKLFSIPKPSVATKKDEVPPTEWPKESMATLAALLRALSPALSSDSKDIRAATHCVFYTPATANGRGYLVATDSHVLFAVKVDAAIAQFLHQSSLTELSTVAQNVGMSCTFGTCPTRPNLSPVLLFGPAKWLAENQDRNVPDWSKVVPTVKLESQWTARLDPNYRSLVDRIANDVCEAWNSEPPTKHISNFLLGDPTNDLTGRVWAGCSILAIIMPLNCPADFPSPADVRDFIKDA